MSRRFVVGVGFLRTLYVRSSLLYMSGRRYCRRVFRYCMSGRRTVCQVVAGFSYFATSFVLCCLWRRALHFSRDKSAVTSLRVFDETFRHSKNWLLLSHTLLSLSRTWFLLMTLVRLLCTLLLFGWRKGTSMTVAVETTQPRTLHIVAHLARCTSKRPFLVVVKIVHLQI